MNRNSINHFGAVPSANIQRSVFGRNEKNTTSFNFGDCVPFYCKEVIPGDSVSLDTSFVARLSTPIAPLMDNMFLDTYYFYVPMRLTWEHTKEFFGENNESAWIPETQYSVPQITPASSGWQVGSVADYMGLPIGVQHAPISALPFRAYALICDHWFRDQNLTDPLYIDHSDTDASGYDPTGSYAYDTCVIGGPCFKASKLHDYFTSALPSPQKGPDVLMPLGEYAPVVNGSDFGSEIDVPEYSLHVKPLVGTYTDGTNFDMYVQGSSSGTGLGRTVPFTRASGDNTGFYFSNIYADLSQATGASINQLRMAFSIQKFYEADARGGSRYGEIIKSHFGVDSPDARLQDPEYLGGHRVPIKVQQAVQTSGTSSSTANDSTPLGTTGAYSLTADVHSDFTKSFTEHGFIIGIAVARYNHSYQQGIDRMWNRQDKFDFYWPLLANIGEQAILNQELFATDYDADDPTDTNKQVFAYQEAWADYRTARNHITGMMRSNVTGSLDVWHLADDYSSLPYLSDEWIREDKGNVDRTLTVTSAVSHQILCDFYVTSKWTRPMPMYSVPGIGVL